MTPAMTRDPAADRDGPITQHDINVRRKEAVTPAMTHAECDTIARLVLRDYIPRSAILPEGWKPVDLWAMDKIGHTADQAITLIRHLLSLLAPETPDATGEDATPPAGEGARDDG